MFLLHSRDMKTQHIKFEILNERLILFNCNLKQLNFVLNMLVVGRICNAIFHPFGDVRRHKKFGCLPHVRLRINRIKSFAI